MTSTLDPPPPRPKRAKRAPTASSDDPATAYARAVGRGAITAGPLVRLACARHLADLQAGPGRGLHWDVEAAGRAIAFFAEVLRLNGGEFEGAAFVLGPWQAFIVGSIFGWRNADGYRRFRTAYMEIGKGNGKSPMAAGIGMYCLVADDEQRAEVYAAATKKDQAMILFRDAVAMRDLSPQLSARLVKTGGAHCWNLAYHKTGSFFRAIASDDGQSGPRPHCSLIDEIHEHPNALVIDMLSLGQKGRRQPLTIEITNSGFDRTSICYQHHEYSARLLRTGEVNDQWFAFVCGLDEGDDPLEDSERGRACWPKANPNLGVSIRTDYLDKEVREARGMPAKASTVRRLNFCQWVDAENPWIAGPLWLACEQDFDALEELAACEETVGALDLSGTRDLSALAIVGAAGAKLIARCEFWTPGDTVAERAKADRVPYDAWVTAGFLNAPPGRGIDYGFIAQRLVDLQVLLPNFRRCAFDPYRIKYLEVELDQLGVEIALIPHPQGYYKAIGTKKDEAGNEIPGLWMPRSVEMLEKAVNDGALHVERNPVLTWNSASAVLEADPKNNRIFTKRRSRGRIDGIVALTMAVGLLRDTTEAAGPVEHRLLFV